MKAQSLNAIAEDKTASHVSKITSFRVDPNKVTFEEGFNLRTDDEELAAHIDRLAAVYEQGGFIPPIDLRVNDKGKLVVVEGHCRVTAARRVRATVKDFTIEARQFRGDEKERVLHMLGTGAGQKALSPLEQGHGFVRLLRFGMSAQEIAAKLGISRVTVDNNLSIAEAPADVQNLIKDGSVSATTAREVIKQGPEAVAALKKAAAEATPGTNKNGKKSKKKKVTTKKLKGTAADKKAKKPKKGKAKKPAAPAAVVVTTPATVPADAAPGTVSILVDKDQAAAAVAFLKEFAPKDNTALAEFAASVEVALM